MAYCLRNEKAKRVMCTERRSNYKDNLRILFFSKSSYVSKKDIRVFERHPNSKVYIKTQKTGVGKILEIRMRLAVSSYWSLQCGPTYLLLYIPLPEHWFCSTIEKEKAANSLFNFNQLLQEHFIYLYTML